MDLSVFPKSTKLQTIRRFVLKKREYFEGSAFRARGFAGRSIGVCLGLYFHRGCHNNKM